MQPQTKTTNKERNNKNPIAGDDFQISYINEAVFREFRKLIYPPGRH